ncbi:MAG: hypothetical protein D6797_01760 [Bdellovibrio sp.]|nr:MAG: hypothetical protein D6797_01760 [Bdellovibrio sp.]
MSFILIYSLFLSLPAIAHQQIEKNSCASLLWEKPQIERYLSILRELSSPLLRHKSAPPIIKTLSPWGTLKEAQKILAMWHIPTRLVFVPSLKRHVLEVMPFDTSVARVENKSFEELGKSLQKGYRIFFDPVRNTTKPIYPPTPEFLGPSQKWVFGDRKKALYLKNDFFIFLAHKRKPPSGNVLELFSPQRLADELSQDKDSFLQISHILHGQDDLKPLYSKKEGDLVSGTSQRLLLFSLALENTIQLIREFNRPYLTRSEKQDTLSQIYPSLLFETASIIEEIEVSILAFQKLQRLLNRKVHVPFEFITSLTDIKHGVNKYVYTLSISVPNKFKYDSYFRVNFPDSQDKALIQQFLTAYADLLAERQRNVRLLDKEEQLRREVYQLRERLSQLVALKVDIYLQFLNQAYPVLKDILKLSSQKNTHASFANQELTKKMQKLILLMAQFQKQYSIKHQKFHETN